jgi:hypothetical protein
MDNGIKYVIVHQVICAAEEAHPSEHGGWDLYHDVPQLFANDHKKSAIRGLYKIHANEDFAADHPDISFAVVLHYSCEQYHDQIADNFEQLEIPPLEKKMRKELEPLSYFASCGTMAHWQGHTHKASASWPAFFRMPWEI